MKTNTDVAMLLTDAILNEFERLGVCKIPLDEHKYSFELQDVITEALRSIANQSNVDDNTVGVGELPTESEEK